MPRRAPTQASVIEAPSGTTFTFYSYRQVRASAGYSVQRTSLRGENWLSSGRFPDPRPIPILDDQKATMIPAEGQSIDDE
jgi:hypothetical protein